MRIPARQFVARGFPLSLPSIAGATATATLIAQPPRRQTRWSKRTPPSSSASTPTSFRIGNVGLVPNVGIVVGSRATLAIDPDSGGATARRCCAKSRK